MNNAILRTQHPPIPLGLVDRLSLQLGTALIRRVETSRQARDRRHERRRERLAQRLERARRQVEFEREQRRLDSTLAIRNGMLFRNLQ